MALAAQVCACLFRQDVATVCRTAAATSPLLASPTDTRPTCTASGGYQSHPGRRYEHMEGERRIPDTVASYLSVCATFGLNPVSNHALLFFFFTDHSQLHLHGSVQEPLVLVRPRGNPRWILEEGAAQRFAEENLVNKSLQDLFFSLSVSSWKINCGCLRVLKDHSRYL